MSNVQLMLHPLWSVRDLGPALWQRPWRTLSNRRACCERRGGIEADIAFAVSQEISPGTLHWWPSRAYDFPLITPLARLVMIPVSQAQPEELLSSAGLIMTRKRNSLTGQTRSCWSPYETHGQQ